MVHKVNLARFENRTHLGSDIITRSCQVRRRGKLLCESFRKGLGFLFMTNPGLFCTDIWFFALEYGRISGTPPKLNMKEIWVYEVEVCKSDSNLNSSIADSWASYE